MDAGQSSNAGPQSHGIAKLATRLSWLIIPLASVLASAPRYLRGISCGHDFDFHLISWMETQRSWSEHVFYPHWAQSPNWGAGEPRFVFYPPLTWIVGALLGYLDRWDYVPAIMIFLILVATGFATCALARQFLNPAQSTLAGALAAVTPYGLFTAYERTAFGELTAAIWIPLLLLYAWRLPRRQRIQLEPLAKQPASLANQPSALRSFDFLSAVPVALLLTLTWLTNAPAGVMASYLLAFAALAAAILRRAWWPIVRALIAAPLGLGLAGFYLVPAAWEQRWIAISQVLDVGMRVSDSWLFARHSAPDMELHDRVLLYASIIAVVTTIMAAIAALLALRCRRLNRENRPWWLPLVILAAGIFLVQLPISAPLWNHLPKLQFLQFPWRWLMVLATPYAILLAAATPLRTRRSRLLSATFWTVVLSLFAICASLFFYQYCDEEDEIRNQFNIFHNGSGMEGTDEYAPAGADNSLIASGLPDGCLVSDPDQQLGETDPDSAPVWYPEQGSCDDTFTADLWQNEHKVLSIDTDSGGYVILRLRRYPAWNITVNGQPANQLTNKLARPVPLRDDGLVVVPVNAGSSTIDVRWINTSDVVWGRSISSISALLLLLLAAMGIAQRRRTPARLS